MRPSAWAARALDLLYPRVCESCGGPPRDSKDGLTCAECAPRAEWIEGAVCRRCGAERRAERCPECGGRRFPFRGAVADAKTVVVVRIR